MTCATPSTPSNLSNAFSRTCHAELLPLPLGPTIIKPWCSWVIWYNCNTCWRNYIIWWGTWVTALPLVKNICIKQIMHSFCVYNLSLTTASGSRLFGSVVRALDFWPRGPGFESIGVESFSAMPYFCSYGFHVVRWGLVRDWTLFHQKLALHHHKWGLPRNGGVLRISA